VYQLGYMKTVARVATPTAAGSPRINFH